MNIDEMKAGPKLDQLACEALGIAPKVEQYVQYGDGTRGMKLHPTFPRDTPSVETVDVFPPVSTDPAAMVAAIPRFPGVTFVHQGGRPLVLILKGLHVCKATGETAMEAFARAAAKTKEGA